MASAHAEFKVEHIDNPGYCISYASASSHAFVIVSRQIQLKGKTEYLVLGSFGLNGDTDKVMSGVSACGLFGTTQGKLHSETFCLINPELFRTSVKSYPITAAQAISVLKKIEADAMINQISKTKKKEPLRFTAEAIPVFAQLTEKENEMLATLQAKIDANEVGGPSLNAFDFNCKKYALYLLRQAGIHDPQIEAGRFPSNTAAGLQRARFHVPLKGVLIWSSGLNLSKSVKPLVEYPNSYQAIFFSKKTLFEGALALLKDYAADTWFNNIVHYKRHYASVVRQVIREVELPESNVKTISALLDLVNSRLPAHRDVIGSLQRRLDFLAEQLDKPMLNQKALIERQRFDKQHDAIEKNFLRISQ